ncbi:MAG: hypothetical protein C0434_02395 [Xanthomonadaceae bacterium]|nr:hypothetical protein [Xanthomonadaceae bacterium]
MIPIRQPAVDLALLRRFVPMDALAEDSLQRLSQAASIRALAAGQTLTRPGQALALSSWLLDGMVQIDDADGLSRTIVHAADPRAAHRLAGPPVAMANAFAVTASRVLCVDGSLLDLLLTWEQAGGYAVAGIDEAIPDDWMTRMLQAPAFQRLPATNLHALFQRLQPVEVRSGEQVIREGDNGDWFYVVVEGRCRIEHQGQQPRALKLAEYGPGDCFGEEALIAGLPRNASAVMLGDGRLMRLARSDFLELLKEPLLMRLEVDDAARRVAAGAARWLDVRLPSEYQEDPRPGSQNLPLRLLRAKTGTLARELLYICTCDSGRRSAVAAYLLTQRGYQAAVLDSR